MIQAAKPHFSRPAELRTDNELGLPVSFEIQVEASPSCPLAQVILPAKTVLKF